eukprot:tig00001497_g9207.t1
MARPALTRAQLLEVSDRADPATKDNPLRPVQLDNFAPMETISNFFTGNRGPRFSADAVFSTKPLTEPVRAHLMRVYSTLAACLLSAALGSMSFVKFGFGGGAAAALGSLFSMLYLAFTPYMPGNVQQQQKRTLALMVMAFFHGSNLGPLILMSLYVDPMIIVTALIATTAIFVCFSGAAIYAKRREYLYLGGVLSSALMVMCITSLLNMFFRIRIIYEMELYAGLLIFCGYILFDSQLIIEKAFAGNHDEVSQALELFLDLVQIFVRILIILLKNKEKERQEKNQRDSRRR